MVWGLFGIIAPKVLWEFSKILIETFSMIKVLIPKSTENIIKKIIGNRTRKDGEITDPH